MYIKCMSILLCICSTKPLDTEVPPKIVQLERERAEKWGKMLNYWDKYEKSDKVARVPACGYVCVHAFIRTCVYMCVHVCTCVYMCVHVCILLCMHTYMYGCTQMCTVCKIDVLYVRM